MYVSDTFNHRLRAISVGTCLVRTIAGSTGGYLDAVGVAARFSSPFNIVWDPNVTNRILVAGARGGGLSFLLLSVVLEKHPHCTNHTPLPLPRLF